MARADTHTLPAFVDRLAARSVLSDEEQQAILARPTHSMTIRARQDFVHIDEKTSYCCFIASGMVARFGQAADGVRQITAFHLPGDVADLHSSVRPVGIGGLNALCESTVLRVRAMAARYPAIAEAFWRDCMLDAAVLMQRVVNVGRRDARARLAHIICEMAIRSGQDREVLLKFALPITQEQMGDAAGLTSVHVNRSLKALRTDRLVTFTSGLVDIHDRKRRAQAGEFHGAYLTADTGPERQRRLLAA